MLDSKKLRNEGCLNSERLREMRVKNCVPIHSDFSYKYNAITSFQVDFQPTKLAKLTYIHLQLIMLIDRMII